MTKFPAVAKAGGSTPHDKIFVCAELSPTLSESFQAARLRALREQSHWPDSLLDADEARQFVDFVDSALAATLAPEDEDLMTRVYTQLNRSFPPIVNVATDGQKCAIPSIRFTFIQCHEL